MGEIVIELNNVYKRFGEIQALKGISLTINQGELFGLLGPNGAGKSTTINLISTLISSDKGSIKILDKDIKTSKREIKNQIGVIPQEIALYEELTAYENLQFWGKIYQISGLELKNRCMELLKMVGLSDRKNSLVKTFSGGMKRRLNIACGLLHNPRIILMDEPTVGVDPQSRNFIFEMIHRLHSIGKTIIYTTHYMEEAEKLCQRIAVIDNGKVIAVGDKPTLYKLITEQESVTIHLTSSVKLSSIQAYFPHIQISQIDESIFLFQAPNINQHLWKLLSVLKELSLEFIDLHFEKPSLEKLFLQLTGRELRE